MDYDVWGEIFILTWKFPTAQYEMFMFMYFMRSVRGHYKINDSDMSNRSCRVLIILIIALRLHVYQVMLIKNGL